MEVSMKKGFTLAEILITLGIIGVVAAITLPTVIKNYQKHVTVTRLKTIYSILNQAVNLAKNDFDDVENWDFSLSSEDFFHKYLAPYIKNDKIKTNPNNLYYGNEYIFYNGSKLKFHNSLSQGVGAGFEIHADINGDKKPNQYGVDKFIFHILPQKFNIYNHGLGSIAQNVPAGGLYPDGYGFNRDYLLNNEHRGCIRRNDGQWSFAGGYCTQLIILDGWKISDDYNW